MKISTRIRFDGSFGKFYIEQNNRLLWIFSWWEIINKKDRYSDGEDVRWFESYDEARTFCIKLATDVVMEHKTNEYSPLL